jgi:phage shock protein PspC (stress-responsive transcriptional regulator)
MVGGVLGGLAQYWNTDPVLLRILTVVLTLFTGGALIIGYIIALIVIPEEAPMGTSPFPPATDAEQVGYASGGTPSYAGYSPTGGTPGPRDRSYLGWLVVSAAVLAGGVLALIGVLAPVSVRMWGVAGGVVLAILGIGLLIGARYGRARWLVIPAIPLAFMSFATVAAGQWAEDNPNWDRWTSTTDGVVVGDQAWTVGPEDVGGAPLQYRLTAGDAVLDLTKLTALGGAEPGRPGQRLEIDAGVALGQLRVIVPADMALDLDATVDAGELRVPGRDPVNGTGLTLETYLQASTGENPAYIVSLDAAVGAGNLEVRREAA